MKIRLIKKYNTGTKYLPSGFEFDVTISKGLELIDKGIAIKTGCNIKATLEEVEKPYINKEEKQVKKENKNNNKVAK